MTVPVRRGPTLLVAGLALGAGVLMAFAPVVAPEPSGRYNPGLTAAFAVIPFAFGLWFASTALRPRWFLRLRDGSLDLLTGQSVPVREIEAADIRGRELVITLTDGPHGWSRAVSAPMRLSGEPGDCVLALLDEHGVPVLRGR